MQVIGILLIWKEEVLIASSFISFEVLWSVFFDKNEVFEFCSFFPDWRWLVVLIDLFLLILSTKFFFATEVRDRVIIIGYNNCSTSTLWWENVPFSFYWRIWALFHELGFFTNSYFGANWHVWIITRQTTLSAVILANFVFWLGDCELISCIWLHIL